MRATQFVRLFLGPVLAIGMATVAAVGSIHGGLADAAYAAWAFAALMGLLALSVGAEALARRERRRFRRDVPQRRCPCCGNAMRGILDGRSVPIWRCVGCSRDEAAVQSLQH
jgi:uncharacterized membrane protein YfcA